MNSPSHSDRVDFKDVFRARLLPASNDLSPVFRSAEESHRWMPAPVVPFGFQLPLNAPSALRIMDSRSQGQIDIKTGRILAADGNYPLDTVAARRETLALHSNHAARDRPSPLISADTCPYSTIDRARRYQANGRGPSQVSLINNNARLRAGYPVLSAYDEMIHYGVRDPYSRNYEYYRKQILYPYAVFAEEIVATWNWSEVEEFLEAHGRDAWAQLLRELLEHHEKAAKEEWRRNNPVLHIDATGRLRLM